MLGACLNTPTAPSGRRNTTSMSPCASSIRTGTRGLAAGSAPPESLTDRRYSGEFRVRTSPSLHSRLAVEATEQGVSLNQWVVQKLADRKTIPTLDDLF
jgi:HicB family